MYVSIMQPYLFPYIGYFQLMTAADTFVVHDDVQYIKGGWINRNRILINGAPAWITLPVKADDHALNINQRTYVPAAATKRRVLRRIEGAYHGAPQFPVGQAIVAEALSSPDSNVAAFNVHAMRVVADAIGITTDVVLSSQLSKDDALAGEARVIAICEMLGGDRYVNLPGGRELYAPAHFAERGLQLSFLEPRPRAYKQSGNAHVPMLSIVDVLMFNDLAAIGEMLHDFELVDA
jgi:hypothetical protein